MEIDPRLADRVAGAGGAQVYPWRCCQPSPREGHTPRSNYEEVETVLVDNTTDALRMAIAGHFDANRNRANREIHGQTSDFANGAALECPHLEINNRLTYEDWISRLLRAHMAYPE